MASVCFLCICRQVMKASKGLMNPKLLNQALDKKLKDASDGAKK